MQLQQLGRIAGWGALLSFGGAAGVHYVTQAGISRSPFYAMAVQTAAQDPEAMRALGGELHADKVPLFRAIRRTRILRDRAEIAIPVTGARDQAGHLMVDAVLEQADEGGPLGKDARWRLERLVLEMEWPQVSKIPIVNDVDSKKQSEAPQV